MTAVEHLRELYLKKSHGGVPPAIVFTRIERSWEATTWWLQLPQQSAEWQWILSGIKKTGLYTCSIFDIIITQDHIQGSPTPYFSMPMSLYSVPDKTRRLQARMVYAIWRHAIFWGGRRYTRSSISSLCFQSSYSSLKSQWGWSHKDVIHAHMCALAHNHTALLSV